MFQKYKSGYKQKIFIPAGLALFLLAGLLAACGSDQARTNAENFSPVPTVTPAANTPTATGSTTTVAQVPPTITPRPNATPLPPTATPQGEQVIVDGPIQQINANNNATSVVINNNTYNLPPETVALLGPGLKVGLRLRFNAFRNGSGNFNAGNIVVFNPVQQEVQQNCNQGNDNEDNGNGNNGNNGKGNNGKPNKGKGND